MSSRSAIFASLCAVLGACSTNIDLGGSPVGPDGQGPDGHPPNCPGFAAPNTSAMCKARAGPLQPNGCFSGYYCRVSTADCQPETVACGGTDGGHDG
jgi:hypothetical protein